MLPENNNNVHSGFGIVMNEFSKEFENMSLNVFDVNFVFNKSFIPVENLGIEIDLD